jgi:hypothetical protein
MNNVGFRYGTMGLDNMSRLADTENRRNWAQYEQDVLENKAQGEAIGALVGTGLGLAKGVYQDYQQGEKDKDAERGARARKEYGVLTDRSKPISQRIGETYGPEANDVVQSRSQRPAGLRDAMREKGALQGRGDLRAEMADIVALQPRISQTGNVLGGKDTQLVSNDPWRDFQAASRYFDGLISR